MDIKINAGGRFVEVTGIDIDLEIAASIVYDLWAATIDTEEEQKAIKAGTYSSLDKGPRPLGFALLGSGERLEVR